MSLYKDKEALFDRIFQTIGDSEDDETPSSFDLSQEANGQQQVSDNLDPGDDSVTILEDDDEPLIIDPPAGDAKIIEDDAIRIEDGVVNLHDVVSLSDEETNGPTKQAKDDADDDDESIHCFSSEFVSFTLQDGNRKNTREIQFSKSDKMFRWKKQYAIELNYKVEDIRLCFDGDVIDDNATPEEADLESGFRIDVHKVST